LVEGLGVRIVEEGERCEVVEGGVCGIGRHGVGYRIAER
jgi:hypothetical protein